jgi:hypothetical protein
MLLTYQALYIIFRGASLSHCTEAKELEKELCFLHMECLYMCVREICMCMYASLCPHLGAHAREAS